VRLEGEDCKRAFETGLTCHDVGLADLLTAARISGAWPDTLILHGAQPASTEVSSDLSATLAARLDELVDRIAADLA
jgi:hydrogenase maturation protease